MTQLRQKMLEELQRRNYSHRTAKTYVRIVRDFAEYFHQPPDKLGPEQIRQYQAHLFQAKKLAPATVSQYVSALRFLFIKTLRRHFLAEYIPFPKSRKRLPTVLSPQEVTRLIDRPGHVDMPLQHIHPRMLELVAVGVHERTHRKLITRIRAGIPGIALPDHFHRRFSRRNGRRISVSPDFIARVPFRAAGRFHLRRKAARAPRRWTDKSLRKSKQRATRRR